MPGKSSRVVSLFILLSITLVACTSITHSPATGTPAAPPVMTQIPASKDTPVILPSATARIPAAATSIIAYIKDGDVWLWTDGRGASSLTSLHDIVDLQISDDGQLVAFKRQDPDNPNTQELWVTSTGNTIEARALVSSQELEALKPVDSGGSITGVGVLEFSWRPNTHEVAYNTLLLHEGSGSAPRYDLRLVDADTQAKLTLFEANQAGMFYYSPDGNQVALSNPDSLSLVDADGSNFRPDVLTFPRVTTYSQYAYCPHPVWASDSRSLRVAIPPKETLAHPMQPTALWSIPVDGSPAVQFADIPAMPFAWPNHAFAPDLAHVLYVIPVGDPVLNQRELHLANPDGTNDTMYSRGKSLEFNNWSPDSQHFTYLVNGGDNQGLHLGGLVDQPVLLAYDQHSIENIQWLDGLHFAYLLHVGSQWILRIRDLSGENIVTIDTLPGDHPTYDVRP